MTIDLEAWAKERAVKYFMISYTDLFGAQRAKLVFLVEAAPSDPAAIRAGLPVDVTLK